MRKIKLLIALFVFVSAQSLFAQNVQVTGTVTGAEDGMGIPGVSVTIKGTVLGTMTDIDGKYALSVPEGSETIVFSFVGMRTKEVPFTGQTNLDVALEADVVGLDEVMVVAYGTVKKESFTGSAGVVGAEKLEKRSLTSIAQAFEGSTTGVQVTAGSGQPGESPKIRIRGFGTLNGDATPLYIVDGAPFNGELSEINAEDIKSMTILKDASSTALYGSRAANGVVMITTKTGNKYKGGMKVSVKAEFGVVSQALPYYETVGPKDYYETMFESYKNSLIADGNDPLTAASSASKGIYSKLKYNPFNVSNDAIVGVDGKINPNAQVIAPDMDWYDALEQVGKKQNYSLSASGGGDNHDFYMSVGYLNETGYFIKSDYERLNARMNINADLKKWLKVGNNLSFVTSTQGESYTGTSNTSYVNPFNFARYMGPIYPIYVANPETGEYILDADGNKQYDLGGGYSGYGINPRPKNNGRHIVAELDYNFNKTYVNTISDRANVEIDIVEGLKFMSNIGVDIKNYRDKEFENPIVGDGAPSGRYSELRYVNTSLNFNQLLNYSTTIQDVHNIEILVGHESSSEEYVNMDGMKSKLTVRGINEFDNYVTPSDLSGYSAEIRREGYLSRLKYNYQNKYYVEGSFRRDGSSVFHPDVRWGNFFSVGSTWRIDQEEFIRNIYWVNSLKLRASYGEVGNDRVGIYTSDWYAYQPLYAPFPNANEAGLRWKTLGNPDLKWESNNSFDVAVEFDLFDRKLRGSVEFYHKISEDLLYNMPLPNSMGLSSQPRNIATMYNQGLEFTIGATVLDKNDLKWDIQLQASTIKNEITEIPDPFIKDSKRWAEGHSVYDYYLYDFYDVDPATGETRYHVWAEDENGEAHPTFDADGNPVLSTNYQDSKRGYVGGTSIPDLFGSISNSIDYKGFNLNFLFTYSIGGKVLDYNYAQLMSPEFGGALHVDALDAWKAEGDQTDVPRLEVNNPYLNYSVSDRFLTDASYLSLKNVNFGYTFKKDWVEKMGLSALKMYVAAENVFMLTKRKGMNPQQSFDGETSNVYLPSRVVSFGVNASF